MDRALEKKGGIMSLDTANYAVAGAAITSPLWLRDLGSVAGDILPVLGVIWLAVQIAHKIYSWSQVNRGDDRRDAR